MDKLQWFKFAPSDWMMGKIQRCDEITQARFMRLVCLYWNKECNLTVEDSIIEIDKEHFDILLSKKIITKNDEHIYIDFLDEQMEGIIETSSKRRDAVNKRWAKVKEKATEEIQNDTSVLQSDTDKSREDKKRTDNRYFDDFWDAYNKKIDRSKCEKKWGKIDVETKMLIIDHVPLYVNSTPEVKYRKNPLTYLNGECWKDEVKESEEDSEMSRAKKELSKLMNG